MTSPKLLSKDADPKSPVSLHLPIKLKLLGGAGEHHDCQSWCHNAQGLVRLSLKRITLLPTVSILTQTLSA